MKPSDSFQSTPFRKRPPRGPKSARRYTRLDEDLLLDKAIAHPRAGARRLAQLLAAEGIFVSERTIRNHLPKIRMDMRSDRAFGLYALECGGHRPCSKEELDFIDIYQPGLRELTESPPWPGYLFYLDIVDTFRLPSQPHLTVYVYVLLDIYSGHAWASFQTKESPRKAEEVLWDEFLPEFKYREAFKPEFNPCRWDFKVQRVLTDSTRTFYRCRNHTHPVMVLFKRHGIEHYIVDGKLWQRYGSLWNVRSFIRRRVIKPALKKGAPKKSLEQLQHDLAHEIYYYNFIPQLSFRPSLNPDPTAPRQSPIEILCWWDTHKGLHPQTPVPYPIPGRQVMLPRRPRRSIASCYRVGYRFERELARWLRRNGNPLTKRQRKSGQGQEIPFDILVPEFGLKIEAKWRLPDCIRIYRSYLSPLHKDFVLAFSIKNDRDRHRSIYALSPWRPLGRLRTRPLPDPEGLCRSRITEIVLTFHKGRKSIRLLRIPGTYRTLTADLLHDDLLIECDGDYYLVEPVEDFLKRRRNQMKGKSGI